jgi:hypothetical protein
MHSSFLLLLNDLLRTSSRFPFNFCSCMKFKEPLEHEVRLQMKDTDFPLVLLKSCWKADPPYRDRYHLQNHNFQLTKECILLFWSIYKCLNRRRAFSPQIEFNTKVQKPKELECSFLSLQYELNICLPVCGVICRYLAPDTRSTAKEIETEETRRIKGVSRRIKYSMRTADKGKSSWLRTAE